jgi:hypothetical protein
MANNFSVGVFAVGGRVMAGPAAWASAKEHVLRRNSRTMNTESTGRISEWDFMRSPFVPLLGKYELTREMSTYYPHHYNSVK